MMTTYSSCSGRAALLVLVVSCIFYTNAFSLQAPTPYPITSDTLEAVSLPLSSWQVLPDPGGKLTLSAAIDNPGFHDDPRVHYRTRTYWIRYSLTNTMSTRAGIALPVEAAYVDLYTKRAGGTWGHQLTGELVRWSRRDGLRRIPAFTLKLAPGETVQVYERLRWDFVAAQPDSMQVLYSGTAKLVSENYVDDDLVFMKAIQDAFLLGLFVLTIIISFYYYLVVREKEFLLFVLFGIGCVFESLSSLNDVFLREYPVLLLYFYVVSNIFNEVLLLWFIRYFLKTFARFPRWDRFLVWISAVIVAVGIFVHCSSAVFGLSLGHLSHTGFNAIKLTGAAVLLTTLALYMRKPDKPVRLIILALVPILSLEFLVYLLYLIKDMYSPRFGAPALHGELSFSRVAFFIMILCYLWMMACFNWVLFLRFSDIGKALLQQTTLEQLRSRFFANISHEFRTPLTLIMGPLEDYQASRDAGELKRFVPAMHRNARRLLELINQLLDLSRLDSNYYRINTVRTDIVPFVRQLVHSFASLAHHKQIDLVVDADSGLESQLGSDGMSFYFDEDIIEKILTNLLSNAFKFTPEGGSITVRLGLPEGEKHMFLLQVTDTGSGISPRQLPYIFDRFYQSDDTDIRQFNGSGIGLSLVRELVRLHQGTVTAGSEPGQGTTISCRLPLNNRITTGAPVPDTPVVTMTPVAADSAELPAYVPGEGISGQEQERQASVLLVEDQPDVRAYIADKLSARFQVIESCDGNQGLEKAFNEIPDLVVSDVMMPGMDGFELCRRLKSDDRTCHIPVILLTARADDTDRITGLGTGADAYVVKPFNSRELMVRIHGLIATRNRIREKFADRLVIKPEEISVTPRDKAFLSNLLAIIEEHIPDERFRVETLAKEVHMSVSQINRKLKGLINQTPQQLIRSHRMLRALHLLKNDAGTIGEISYQVGYEDPGYFSKVFKSHFGCLPSEKDRFPENPEAHATPSPPSGS